MTQAMIHDTAFIGLSELLTGEDGLDPDLAEAYRARLAKFYPKELATLVRAFAKLPPGDRMAALQAALDADKTLSRMARQVITVWMTSQFTRPDGTQDPPGTPEQYRSSLLWAAIRAHPPSHSTRHYGYWAHHP